MRIQHFFMTKDSVVHVTCNTTCSQGLFLEGGGGERNQWPGSAIFDSNCLWHQQYVVENHKNTKQ